MALKAAVIGVGRIGSENADDPKIKGIYSHAGAYYASDGIDFVGVCDADSKRASRSALRWNLPVGYTKVSELLALEKPEIVSVCTPDSSHAQVLKEVLACDSVKGVLAEKPLALTFEEGKELCALAENRGVVLAVNYIRRYARGHQHVADLIRQGAIGTVCSISGMYSGGLLHNGSHWFDLVRWLVGEIAVVQGYAAAHQNQNEADSSLDARIEFTNGARGYLYGFDASRFSVFELDITGTSGRIRITDSGHHITMDEVVDSPHYSGYRSLRSTSEFDGGLADVMINAIQDLLICVDEGQAPLCTGLDGVRAMQVCEAVRRSVLLGRPMGVG